MGSRESGCIGKGLMVTPPPPATTSHPFPSLYLYERLNDLGLSLDNDPITNGDQAGTTSTSDTNAPNDPIDGLHL